MSGIGPMTHGSYEIGPKYEELPALADAPTIQRYFKDHGYQTLSEGRFFIIILEVVCLMILTSRWAGHAVHVPRNR